MQPDLYNKFLRFTAATFDTLRRGPAHVERTLLGYLCAKFQPYRLSQSRDYST